jgi:dihydrofolate reductase / thymidylate synthase
MTKINVILICDIKGGIAKNGKIPWKFTEDLKYFKKLTSYVNKVVGKNTLIMGRKTFDSLPCDYLPNRQNVILTTKSNYEIDELYKYDSSKVIFKKNLFDAINYGKNNGNDIWIIGGANVYKQAMNYYQVNNLYINIIQHDFECDQFIDIPKVMFENSTILTCSNELDNKKYNIYFNKLKINNGVETQYLKLLDKILTIGNKRQTRNGYTLSLFSAELKFNLSEGFPLLTTKKMFWKGIVEELLFFIRGDTNTKNLEKKGVNIWKGNTTREFLDKMGFDYEEGNMGPMYGYQWRNFNSQGIDQLKEVIELIKKDSHSRRIIMTDYNPIQAKQGVLYPCHSLMIQFYVHDRILSIKMYQRSADAFLGLPFNIASTSLLLHIISSLTGLEAGDVTITLGDCHIYEEHIEAVITQLKRTNFKLPKLKMSNLHNLEDVEKSNLKDYNIVDYSFHPRIKAKMKA